MKSHTYCFPLSIQTVLPEQYREDDVFKRNLETLQEFGFHGVELNITHPDKIDLADVICFLKKFDLELTMFASGLTAKTLQLSLSSFDPDTRQRSVAKCREMIDFVAGHGAGIIVGFLKGTVVKEVQRAREQFRLSLQQINPYIKAKKVPIRIEATNRYESSIANSLDDTVDLLKNFKTPFIQILPDTFHMNIEETDEFAALTKYTDYYTSIHISDNNRYFPGFGAIKFDELFRFLKALNYQGGLAIEGNIKENFVDDVKTSIKYLMPLLT